MAAISKQAIRQAHSVGNERVTALLEELVTPVESVAAQRIDPLQRYVAKMPSQNSYIGLQHRLAVGKGDRRAVHS